MAYFSKIRIKKPRRHLFNLSHEHLTTFNMGELIPIYWEETLPGDKFSVGVESFLRFMPMISPVMHRINLRFYAFFVPNRLIFGQDLWEEFITGGSDGSNNQGLAMPYIQTFPDVQALCNYLGLSVPALSDLGTNISDMLPVNSAPIGAYFKIWNDYFRDQNLQDELSITVHKNNGQFGVALTSVPPIHRQGVLRKCWEKDYFTSALPWLQRGNPADLPISFSATDITTTLSDVSTTSPLDFGTAVGGETAGEISLQNRGTQNLNIMNEPAGTGSKYPLIPRNLSDFLTAESTMDDIEASFTINDLRRAEALQRWMEKSARGGSRYIEQIRSFFGVVSSDARLQRPEFLGALSSPVSISEVLQHSQTTTDGTPLGEMGGHGISATGNWIFRNKFFEEHGIIMILACVQPRTSYYGSMTDRRFYKPDRFHFYWPDFARIGEQPVFKGELFNSLSSSSTTFDESVFGYQERYSEYKQRLNRISGDFQATLDFWHLGRSFNSKVALNSTFVTCSPSSRIFAVEDADTQKLLGDFFLKVKAFRPIIPHVIPGL